MSMTSHVTHYCLNMIFCRWPQCHSVHSCSCVRMYVITYHSISLGIRCLPSTIHYFKSSVFEGHIPYNFLSTYPWRRASGNARSACRPGALETPDYMWYLKTSLPTKQHFHNDFSSCMMMFASTAHPSEISMQVLKTKLPDILTSPFMSITWYAHFPDLFVPVPYGLCQNTSY
jgi:hypothetical protein